MLLGAVGAYDWNGTVVMQTATGSIVPTTTSFDDPLDTRKEAQAGYVGKMATHERARAHSQTH